MRISKFIVVSSLLLGILVSFQPLQAQQDNHYATLLQSDRLTLFGYSDGGLLMTDRYSCADGAKVSYNLFKSTWEGDPQLLTKNNPGRFNISPIIGVGDKRSATLANPVVRRNMDMNNQFLFCVWGVDFENEIVSDDDYFFSNINFQLLLGDFLEVDQLLQNSPVAPITNAPGGWPENIYGLSYWPESFHEQVALNAHSATVMSLTEQDQIHANPSLEYQIIQQSYLFEEELIKDIAFFDLLFVNNSSNTYEDVFIGLESDISLGKSSDTNIRYTKDRSTIQGYELIYFQGGYRLTASSTVNDSLFIGILLPLAGPVNGEATAVSGVHIGISETVVYWEKYMGGKGIAAHAVRRSDSLYYGLMSGDTSYLTPLEFSSISNIQGFEDDSFQFTGAENAWGEIGSIATYGPFSSGSGDTLRLPWALIFSNSEADLFQKAAIGTHFFNADMNTDFAPPGPELSCRSTASGIQIHWDATSETVIDPLTGYLDFEGYRLYRSTQPPHLANWGEPIYQVDLDNGIYGTAYINPDIYLGDDTGLFYTFTDTDVHLGITYYYFIQAYDRGIDPNHSEENPESYPSIGSYATPLPRSMEPVFIDSVTYGNTPTNIIGSQLQVIRDSLNIGNAVILAELLNDIDIQNKQYDIVIAEDSDTDLKGYIYQVDVDTVLIDSQYLDYRPGSIIDGWRLAIDGFEGIDKWYDSTYWTSGNSNWDIYSEPYRNVSLNKAGDFWFVFAEDTVTSSGKTGPWRVFKRSTGAQLDWNIFQNSFDDDTDEKKNSWTSGDGMIIFDGGPVWLITLTSNPEVRVDENGDYYTHDAIPQLGDTLLISAQRPWQIGDRFTLNTRAIELELDPGLTSSEPAVTVFPNPYTVAASWQDSRTGVAFAGLEYASRLRVFTQTGDLVWEYEHSNTISDVVHWDLTNQQDMDVAYGLYLWHVEMSDHKTQSGKLVVIR